MALTRKMLAAMDIPAEKIDEIITAHTETVNAIKEERDALKAKAEEVETKQKELEKAKKEIEEFSAKVESLKSEDWEGKFNTLKGEYDAYKSEIENKETKAKKSEAYKQLLLNAGVSDKRIPSIMRITNVDDINLDEEGNIVDSEKMMESVKEEWSDFIIKTSEQGATVANPPTNTGGETKEPSLAAQMVAQYRNEHYGNPKED